MDLSKIPPFMALSLGLIGCTAFEACLSPLPPDTEVGDVTTGVGSADDDTTTTGPCLDPQIETTSTGPCLGAPMDSSGTDTGTGTGTGSDSGTGSGSDTGTSSGGMLDEPPPPTTRAAAVERVLARGTLPADVLDRLRALTGPSTGQAKE